MPIGSLFERPLLTVISSLKRTGIALILFAAVYAPAFATVAVLHLSIKTAIPLIILVSAGLAALIMAFLADGAKRIGEFGVAMSPASYVFAATLAGILVGGVLAYIAALYPTPAPFDVSKLRPWMILSILFSRRPCRKNSSFGVYCRPR